MLNKFEAISKLVGGGISGRADGAEIDYHGKTPPTDAEIETAWVKMQADYNALAYARNRASTTGYPSIPDQLDEIYHNGIDSWKALIKVTKDKYPKG